MRRRTFWLSILAIALIGAVAGMLWPRGTQPLSAELVTLSAPADPSGFARAEGPRPLNFPADRGPHNDFQTEWWYYTGNLTAATGEHFGYQLTFFRRALLPPDQRAARDSAWGTEQIYMAHFAVTDVSDGRHDSFERLTRGAAGQAGAQSQPYRVWLQDWEVVGGAAAAGPARLRASAGGTSLDLTLTDLKAVTLQGDQGYSRKGPEPGNASYYISSTRIDSEGVVTLRGERFAVSGLSWMDHEWSTSALAPGQVGWDWFSIQLDDDTELMAFQLRRADGSADGFSSGTLIASDGSTRSLGAGDFTLEPIGRWRSPRTGVDYPSGWIVSVPAAELRLTATPWLADQEMQVSFTYWEGAVKVEGTAGGEAVQGNGYVELTGYAGAVLIAEQPRAKPPRAAPRRPPRATRPARHAVPLAPLAPRRSRPALPASRRAIRLIGPIRPIRRIPRATPSAAPLPIHPSAPPSG